MPRWTRRGALSVSPHGEGGNAHAMNRRLIAPVATLLWTMAVTLPAAAQTPSAGGSVFLSAMPPGDNGNSAGGIGVPIPDIPVRRYPPNFVDQLALYGDLSYARPGLRTKPCVPPSSAVDHVPASGLVCNYYKPAGLDPDIVASQ